MKTNHHEEIEKMIKEINTKFREDLSAHFNEEKDLYWTETKLTNAHDAMSHLTEALVHIRYFYG